MALVEVVLNAIGAATRHAIDRLERIFERRHRSISALAPYSCFVVVLSLVTFMRIVSIYAAAIPRCIDYDQFRYSSLDYNWPLFGTFFFAVLLTPAWTIVVVLTQWRSCSSVSNVVHGAAQVAVCGAIWAFIPLHAEASYTFYKRSGDDDEPGTSPFPIGDRLRR